MMWRLLLLICLGALLAGCGTSSGGLEALNGTPLPYSVVETGGWPNTQKVGVPVDLVLRSQNIGKPVPHFVLVVDGLIPTWTVKGVKGCGHGAVKLKPLQSSPAWDFGPLQKSQECDITFHLVPNSAVNSQNTVYVRSFGAVINKRVGESVPVNGGVQLIAGINP